MIKGTKTIGLKVIATDTGKEIDKVNDVIYDPATNLVMALLLDEGGWFSEAKIILMKDIASIGPDAVIVATEDVVRTASEVPQRVANIAKSSNHLTRTKVVTATGVNLGYINDIYFELPLGEVVEFEVSEGLVANIATGLKTIKVDDIMTVGEDAIIVQNYTETVIQEQSQERGAKAAVSHGLAAAGGMLSQAKDKVVEASKTVTEHPKVQQLKEDFQSGKMEEDVKNTVSGAKDTVTNQAQQTKEKVEETANQAKEDQFNQKRKDALGKYLKVNVPLGSDQMIPRNTIITDLVLEAAEKHDMLDKVLSNASETPLTA